jgi:hypothetical protein
LYTVGEIDLLILNFRPNNLLRFVILQKNRHTALSIYLSIYLITYLIIYLIIYWPHFFIFEN